MCGFACFSQMDQTGCASHVFNMSIFTKNAGQKMLIDRLSFNAKVEEEGTGKSFITRIWRWKKCQHLSEVK